MHKIYNIYAIIIDSAVDNFLSCILTRLPRTLLNCRAMWHIWIFYTQHAFKCMYCPHIFMDIRVEYRLLYYLQQIEPCWVSANVGFLMFGIYQPLLLSLDVQVRY